MSIHKLTAGSGYDYLTRQVAALDATDKGHTGLATYYTERGEAPGVWTGSGMAGIDGLAAGDVVTAEQMQALFGSGHHPLARQRREQLVEAEGADASDARVRAVTRLGTPFKVYDGDISAYRLEVAKRVAALNADAGLPGDWPVPAEQRARVRTQVAAEFFAAEHGRQPADARELAATIAQHSRPNTTAVAGYDLCFSPVKSVSTLWAVADPAVAAQVEAAHQAAVADALAFLEAHALFTRTGTNGVRQVNVCGLVATAFTHRDSRAGDPDLHTHVAVANKVQTLDGRWLAIDGRVLFKANVAASETYNTALERHLHDRLGVRFAERAHADARKRPVREIVGVDPALNERWSARRASIEDRRGELAAAFQSTHGRPPTPVESIQLAQQATLETREAKHEPRTLAEQRSTWHAQAVEVLGSRRSLDSMVRRALCPDAIDTETVDARWLDTAADRVLAAVQQRRATWRTWHVRAEAHRQLRATDLLTKLSTAQVEPVVDLLVDQVLHDRSVSLAQPADGIVEPAQLRRPDGTSVYTVAGAHLYTSTAVLAAEHRLVDLAGRTDGRTTTTSAVELALLESTANGVELNAGQAALVRQMATSGARLQLAIAPAGSGKTTAMRALAAAWAEGGGPLVGLAPSAAAAEALHTQIDTRTDTLAKLVWALHHDHPPAWVEEIGPSTLVVIDEAGMADTLSLDTAVQFIVGRGGSVRLVGDDQQLAAIGAGGVLRDIAAAHGAVHLSELLRFADPAEGAASLALRDGLPEALGFYLDRDRVHVGDKATMTDAVFDAWRADRGRGLDALMLAPTRELVSELNQRARTHRLTGSTEVRRERRLADGNRASVGELVITRANDRRLRTSATDWVKNGDRWQVLAVHRRGDLTVAHTRTSRRVRLPSGYVDTATELGYATTTHAAQGVTADTVHGLAGGSESRQQLYTMLTRGRAGNHVYLEAAGDGDPHSVIRPELVHPRTPTEVLEQVLARDEAPTSATTLQRQLADPRLLLGEATARYVDALYVAAENVVGPTVVETLDTSADRMVAGLSEQPAWPVLRAHLLLLAADGEDPVQRLQAAVAVDELDTAADPAAVLDWRLDETGLRNAGTGPLPWIPGIPGTLRGDPRWGDYLTRRADRVADLGHEVRYQAAAASEAPTWARARSAIPADNVLADVALWRAAMQVAADDRRPTGPPQLQKAPARWQRHLAARVAGDHAPAVAEWGVAIAQAAPTARADDFTPLLAARLAAISRAGIDAAGLLRVAADAGRLPDDHAVAALWWRISRHLSPAVAADVDRDHTLTTQWTSRLPELLGPGTAKAVQDSPWWPSLVATIDHGMARGWPPDQLLTATCTRLLAGEDDPCQAMVWRAAVLMDPVPGDHDADPAPDPSPEAPEDVTYGVEPPADAPSAAEIADYLTDHVPTTREAPMQPAHDATTTDPTGKDAAHDPHEVDSGLLLAGLLRDVAAPPEPDDADVERMLGRAAAWDHCPVTRERMLQVNQLTLAFFQQHFARSWGRNYLAERFGTDLTGDPRFQPGQAPPGWTRLVDYLRRHGVTDEEMTTTGVATVASTGRLIDRFRDRVVFPISHRGKILGFVGRRHPEATDTDNGGKAGPNYLNTADTVLFHKGAQLFAHADLNQQVANGAVPVVVEGPMDAVAVTLATRGTHVGVAPLGTALTDEQAANLAGLGVDPVIATDADLAGRVAAERSFWTLTPHLLDPTYARLPHGSDPAELLAHAGPAALRAALTDPAPLGQVLVDERLAHLPTNQALADAARVVAARPAHAWAPETERISTALRTHTADDVRRDLLEAVQHWDADPRQTARLALSSIGDVRTRLETARDLPPRQRWAALANELDPRLVKQPDWGGLAALMQLAHDHGHDVPTVTRHLLDERSLDMRPAEDLRYRIVSHLCIDVDCDRDASVDPTQQRQTQAPVPGAARERQRGPQPDTAAARPRR